MCFLIIFFHLYSYYVIFIVFIYVFLIVFKFKLIFFSYDTF